MPGECNYPRYCQSFVEHQQPALVRGKLYHLEALGYPGLGVGEDSVWGYLLTLKPPFSLAQLDALEGYDPQRLPHLNEYNRERLTVYDEQENIIGEAWGYRMSASNIQRYHGQYLTTGRWRSGQNPFNAPE